MTSPYEQAVDLYWRAGWRGVLPLPANDKGPVPVGYTGWAGVEPSRADIQAWIEYGYATRRGRLAVGNIGLRLPRGTYGLDVDAYGTKTGAAALSALTERLGPLPATWCVSSRDDGISGIRLFRAELSGDRRWRDEPGGHGAGIEAIHFGHRYSVVWPSVHPETGRKYVWRGTEGVVIAPDHLPVLDQLPELPAAWIEHLSEPGEIRTGDMAGHAASVELFQTWRQGPPCTTVKRALDAGLSALAGARDGAALHPAGRDAINSLVNLGNEGHVGVSKALSEHGHAFIEVRLGRPDANEREAGEEWWRMVRGAVGKLPHDQRREQCDCDVWAGVGLDYDPRVDPEAWLNVPPKSEPATPSAAGVLDDPADVEQGEISALASAPPGTAPAPPVAGAVLTPAQRIRAEMVSARDMAKRPAPQPIVSGLLYRDTLAWLIGKSGSFKSFVALDVAAAIAGGRPWANRRVWGGTVVYVVAEGAGGMPLRVQAWERQNGPIPENLIMLPRAIQILGPNWSPLIEVCVELQPVMVLIDTQARSTVGMKENDNAEMGQMVDRLDALRRATGACVWTVHHIGRQGEDARGASALDGAQDTELKVERVGGPKSMTARLKIDKQKDAADTLEIDLTAELIELGTDPHSGEPLSSLVVSPGEFDDPVSREAPWRVGLGGRQVAILDILRELFSEQGGTQAEVRAALRERRPAESGWVRNTFHGAWNRLLQADLIERVGRTQRYVVVDDNATVTIDGDERRGGVRE